jgi:hypothetical protein
LGGVEANELLAMGLVGEATITGSRATGAEVDGDPELELELAVSVDGQAPYSTQLRQVISRLAAANYQPGATVSVRVDPDDRDSLMIG